jgi:hypothetical protein
MKRLRKARPPAPRIWIVLHGEVALGMDGWGVSEEVHWAASSLHAVRRLIRKVQVDPGCWWRVESARLDDLEGTRAKDQPEILFYSAEGKPIPAPDLKAGYREALRRQKRSADLIEKRLSTWKREGHPKIAIQNMKNCLRTLRRVLSRHRAKERRFFSPRILHQLPT